MKKNMNFNMYIHTHSVFGKGTLNELGKLPMPSKKTLIIISNGKSTRSNGYLDHTEKQLNTAVMGVMFTSDRIQMLDEDIMQIFADSYK